MITMVMDATSLDILNIYLKTPRHINLEAPILNITLPRNKINGSRLISFNVFKYIPKISKLI